VAPVATARLQTICNSVAAGVTYVVAAGNNVLVARGWAGGPQGAALPCSGYGFSVLSKMSVRFARLPSLAIAKNATNEFPARASPS
jgi:hypothetical protein